MESSLLPWKMLVYKVFMRALKSLRSCLKRVEGCPLAFYSSLRSFSSSWMRCWQAFCLSDSMSFIFFSIFSSLLSQKLRSMPLRIDYITIHMKRDSWGSSMIDSPNHNKVEPRRNASYRRSSRKPIFDSPYRTSTKQLALRSMPSSSQSFHIQFQSISNDDYCGCEHNLQPCPIVRQLLKGVSEPEMRRQYERLESLGGKRSRVQLRRKYFRLLPSYYPEIFHAHLANLIANVAEELTAGQFVLLASLQYHAKYQHITFFLFEDLRKAQKGKKMFLAELQTALIAHEVDYPSLLQSSRKQGIALPAFLQSYRETFGACIVPLSQYARFIKILLSKGYKSLRNLLIILLSAFQESLFDLLQRYANQNDFRQKARTLFWQKYFERLTEA